MKENKNLYNTFVILVSVIVPLIVGLLFTVRIPGVEPLTFLPPIYSGINAIVSVLLIAGVYYIKNGSIKTHDTLMKISILLSALFLVLYMAYHITSDPTPYGGDFKYIYYFILISHIALSIVIIPFVLITYVKAITNDIVMHKKIARITYPLWLYVTVTGVIVYFMISPYYEII